MPELFRFPTPIIGTKGVYSATSPFTIEEGEIFECIAVRTLKSYIANNDDPFKDIYEVSRLTESDYEQDLKENMEIVSLQNEKGYTLLIPARYLSSYPVQDGVAYRSMAISVFMPAIPVSTDLTSLMADMQALVKSNLGIDTVVTPVETSRPQMLSFSDHEHTQIQRELLISQRSTLYAQLAEKNALVTDLLARISVLETHIIDNP